MPVFHNTVDTSKFNRAAVLPFQMRREDVQLAMQDVYDFFYLDPFLKAASLGKPFCASAK